jgi:hypothetical protein
MGRWWDRLGAAGGLLGVALSLGGFALIGAAGYAVNPPASTEDVARALQDGSMGLARIGIFIDVLGSLFFILFIARLWATLRQAEGHPAWFSVTVFAADRGVPSLARVGWDRHRAVGAGDYPRASGCRGNVPLPRTGPCGP